MKTKLLLLTLLISLSTFGQKDFWKATKFTVDHNILPENRLPAEYKTYEVEFNDLRDYLRSAPDYFSKTESNIIVNIPDEAGNSVAYRVYKSHTMSPGLQERAPEISAYRAFGVNNKSDVASIVTGATGLHIGIFRTGKHDLIIQPATNDLGHVIVYTKDQVPPQEFECYVDDSYQTSASDLTEKSSLVDDELLRTYRFAVGVTAEYSNYHVIHSGLSSDATDEEKKTVVLSAVTVTIDRVNTVYERDFGVLLELVPNEIEVIFLDPDTDPYNNDNIMSMLNGNTGVLNSYIGAANYDGGHLFSTYPGGGISGLGIICTSSKGRSVTGLANPVGDSYDIDFVAHEIGHAFGCNHTYANACNGQRNLPTSMEPGSGSTIMAYAGVCSPNLQGHSDDIFHVISITEATNFITNHATCSINTDIGNHKPVISVVEYGTDVYIPKKTPVLLEASATDADDDALTYIWEEVDPVNSANSSITSWFPNANHTAGPEFRSYQPNTSGVRMLPIIASILNNTYHNTWEVLPEIDRTLNFAITVRDNHPGGGQTPSEYISLHFDPNTGPFRITNMAQGATLQAGQDQTITWDVAGTDGGLVNCASVDVLFSVDNGQTFPYVIAENLPNTGTAIFTIPGYQNTNLARFMLKAHDNYFFDVAKGRFTIEGASGGVNENNISDLKVYPNPASKTLNIVFTPDIDNNTININLYDISGRKVYSNELTRTRHFNYSMNVSNLAKGIYYLKIKNGDKQATQKIIIE